MPTQTNHKTAKITRDTEIGLDDRQRQAVVGILNRVLSDTYVLLVKTRNYHWNVTGQNFSELHKLFEEQYEALNESADEVAERARALGGWPLGTMSEWVKNASLKEKEGDIPTWQEMLANLLRDHEQVIRNLRKDVDATASDYNDAGTSDFLTGLMEAHEKMAWMLRAYFERA